ncbi:MFS transporter [Marinilabiliaceae bacterium JC017]|nr:MFS transporter [Marinilabiliaceae bacterium JC017]
MSEYQVFLSYPRDMRVLLITNMIYALVLPVIDIFVAAYIMRNSNDPTLVAIYQLAVYTGIPITFMINGFLLRKIRISNLYSFGMLLSGASMLFMMTLNELNIFGVALSGLIMGASFGFFWANRDFLALDTTNDENRNYYYGVETFFYTITSIVVPFIVGWFLISSRQLGWFGGNITTAYQLVTVGVFAFTIISSLVIHTEKFRNPFQKKFVFIRFHELWNKMLVLAGLKGLVQGYLVTAPAILIMTLVGDENSLGSIQSISGIFTAIVLYLLGRFSKPRHRIYIFSVGLLLFVVGTLANAVMFSAIGVVVFMLAKVLFQPLHDIAYFPIQMRVIDVVSKKEKRNEFAYIFNHEFGLYLGRIIGLVMFLLLANYVSLVFALKYSLLIVAVIQLVAIPIAKHIIQQADKEADVMSGDTQGA